MTGPGRFVCAFRGARDRYQAPLALAEAGLLDQFITDAYATPMLRRLGPSIIGAKTAARFAPGIPDERIACLWGTTAVEHARHRLGYSPRLTWLSLDRRFSEAAAERARQTRSHLFLYSPYAWEAFTASYAHTPMKVLFQYHPHPATEARLMAEDHARFPGLGESFELEGDAPPALLHRERDAWRHADLIVCSSAFTRQSLVDAGCDPGICRVLPYGVETALAEDVPPEPAFQALFVGSGGHRKGLHHLLLAWQSADLPQDSRLTLACRVIDRRIQALAASVPRVRLLQDLSAGDLERAYASSSLFVMPSIVEGFGHVYLEALARGCPVLGTTHTCLPDLGAEADGVFLTPVGDIEALKERLEHLASRLPGDKAIRGAARATAARYPWAAFRSALTKTISGCRASLLGL